MEKNNIDIKKIIIDGGATLNKNGEDFVSNKGFMVSIKGQEVKVDKNDIQGIKKEIEKKREFIKDKKELYIGLWLDSDIMYIDVSIHIIDYLEALEVARDNDQKAIFDLKNKTSIYLNYSKYYTLYNVIKDEEGKIIDYKIIRQYNNIEEIIKDLNIKKQTLYNCISKNLDEVHQLIFNRLALVVDKISEEELIA